MREILFRGRDTHEVWQYGDYIRYDDEMCNITDTTIYRHAHLCNTETVGQYTGLTDKNGTKIFEGDIVKLTDDFVDFETYAIVEFGNPNGLYNWGWQLRPLENKPFAVEILQWVEMEESGAYIEVIGNIHDNPELLNEKE